jgi:hypothetical protein
MNELIEILKYTIPAIIVFFTVWLVLKSLLLNFENHRRTELLMKNHEITIPLRLQAYERIVLLLERISIEAMLTRLNQPGMSVRQLHGELVATVRNEYEHNLSQQVYVSANAWEMVKNARAQIVRLINTSFENSNPTASAIELSKKIIENIGEYPKSPTQTAIDFIKAEIQDIF